MPNRIKELRDRADLSQAALAERIGTSGQQIGRLETGERKLTEKWARLIAGALGVSLADIFVSEGKQHSAVAPESYQLVDDPDKLAWLRLYEEFPPVLRKFALARVREDLAALLAQLREELAKDIRDSDRHRE
jgi:transcriptional regulator with XRE-family HTH domain